MRSRAELARQWLRELRRVVAQAEPADVAIDFRVEKALLQPQPEREKAHQGLGQYAHRTIIFGECRLDCGGPLRPPIDSKMLTRRGSGRVGRINPVHWPDHEGFVQITSRSRYAARAGHRFA